MSDERHFSAMQWRVRHFLLSASSKEIVQKDIEEEFGMRPPSDTEILKQMEKRGLIQRKISERDSR